MPLLGAASLAEARQEISAGVRGLDKLAREALAAGNLNNAEQLVAEALRRDPNDTEAQAIKGALAKRRAADPPAAGGACRRRRVARSGAVPPPPAPQATKAPTAGDAADLNLVGPGAVEPPAGTMAEGFENNRRIIAQMIQTEVQNTISQARSLMGTDPDRATQQLKLTLEKVRQTAELNPDVRDQVVDVLQTALREAARRKVEFEYARQKRLENMAAGKEQALIAESLIRNQDKAKQLIARFNSLMLEGRYQPAKDVATEAQKVLPENPVPLQAFAFASLKGNYETEHGAQAGAAAGFSRHAVPSGEVAHPVPRRSADRLLRSRSLATTLGPAQRTL